MKVPKCMDECSLKQIVTQNPFQFYIALVNICHNRIRELEEKTYYIYLDYEILVLFYKVKTKPDKKLCAGVPSTVTWILKVNRVFHVYFVFLVPSAHCGKVKKHWPIWTRQSSQTRLCFVPGTRCVHSSFIFFSVFLPAKNVLSLRV